MESALSIVGTMTALVSAIIALSAYTAESRLHRRINRLQSVMSLMNKAPSPVINRALRYSLAELQSREALREQRKTAFSLSFVLPPLKMLFFSLLTISLLAFVAPGPLAADYSASLALGLVWLSISAVAPLLLARGYLLEFRRRDFRNAFFSGDTPSQEDIKLPSLHKLGNEDVRRAVAAGMLVAVACDFAGAAVGLLAFAATVPAYASFFFGASGLAGATAIGLYLYGHAPRVRAKDSSVWPWPKRSDFQARR
ncbi:hypothetical protein ACFQRD_10015 [Brachybacterium sp. GCM10030268]|uniref:hypothetical protein n=1 Tax=Brachybacterium sp. GCM10030268 TaxID=3273382 RepID=UPI0036074A56